MTLLVSDSLRDRLPPNFESLDKVDQELIFSVVTPLGKIQPVLSSFEVKRDTVVKSVTFKIVQSDVSFLLRALKITRMYYTSGDQPSLFSVFPENSVGYPFRVSTVGPETFLTVFSSSDENK